MERVLCPVDLRPDTLNALEAAAQIAAAHQAQLILLHVLTQDEYSAALEVGKGEMENVEILQHSQQSAMDRLCDSLRETLPNLHCNSVLRHGDAIATILDEAVTLQASLIVMGSHGVHDITEAMDGNHPVKVIEQASCPVLCVPEGTALELPATVIYGSRMKAEDADCLQRLVALLYPFGSKIVVVYVGDESTAKQEQWQDHIKLIRSYVSYQAMEFYFHPWKEEDYLGLNDFLLQMGGQMLVLLTHQRNFLQRIFQKSVFKQITYFSQFPFLVYLEDHLNSADKHNV